MGKRKKKKEEVLEGTTILGSKLEISMEQKMQNSESGASIVRHNNMNESSIKSQLSGLMNLMADDDTANETKVVDGAKRKLLLRIRVVMILKMNRRVKSRAKV